MISNGHHTHHQSLHQLPMMVELRSGTYSGTIWDLFLHILIRMLTEKT